MAGFLTLCLTPTFQRTLRFPKVERGEVNRSNEYRLDASGKGINVTRVLQQLGFEATHLTHLGGAGRESFLALASADGIVVDWVESESEIRTCYTVLDDADRSTTELVEEAAPVGAGTEERLMTRYLELLSDHHTVIISGAKSAGYSKAILPWLVKEAKEAGLRVIADFRGPDLEAALEHRPDLIKPNLSEFAATFLAPHRSSPFGPQRAKAVSEETTSTDLKESAKQKMREIADEGTAVVLTRGGKPTLFAFPGGVTGEVSPIEIEPLNTIGCGDAFTAGFAAEWVESGEL
ncbi:MAG: 1-phosphofructokinase family hexose kinase, partial [Spirochaetaceae bacterium]